MEKRKGNPSEWFERWLRILYEHATDDCIGMDGKVDKEAYNEVRSAYLLLRQMLTDVKAQETEIKDFESLLAYLYGYEDYGELIHALAKGCLDGTRIAEWYQKREEAE